MASETSGRGGNVTVPVTVKPGKIVTTEAPSGIGKHGKKITWEVTNEDSGAVTVRVSDFATKGVAGFYWPFKEPGPPASVTVKPGHPPGKLTLTVADKHPREESGLRNHEYRIGADATGGDPELSIEWP